MLKEKRPALKPGARASVKVTDAALRDVDLRVQLYRESSRGLDASTKWRAGWCHCEDSLLSCWLHKLVDVESLDAPFWLELKTVARRGEGERALPSATKAR